jgi:hypothetical protein
MRALFIGLLIATALAIAACSDKILPAGTPLFDLHFLPPADMAMSD